MKKLFLFLCISFISTLMHAVPLAKVNVAVVRNNQIKHGPTIIVQDNSTNIAYQDERTYIEVDVVEISETQIVLRCLVSTASEANTLVVRGMPRLTIPINDSLGMASLNCDGKDEHFMLIACVCPC